MKTFLLAVVALFATNLAAHAAQSVSARDQLIPADQISTLDGLDSSDFNSAGMYPPPPPHPYPHPVPPPHPYPHPVPPPYPYPHPVPPPYPYPHPYPQPHPPVYWYECSAQAQDSYGAIYTDRGQDPIYTQRDAHNRCEQESGVYCQDLGCRRL